MDRDLYKMHYTAEDGAWQFTGLPWKTNEEGHMISPHDSYWSMDTHTAYYTKYSFRDFILKGSYQIHYAGGANMELIVRSQDSRRFYAVRFNIMGSYSYETSFIMASVWKGCEDGYRRMLGYRKKVGLFSGKEYDKWYDVRVECAGQAIMVYFGESRVLAVRDAEYEAGAVGVSVPYGIGAWKDLEVEGTPDESCLPWKKIENAAPNQFAIGWDTDIAKKQKNVQATLLPDDEIYIGFTNEKDLDYKEKGEELVIRSKDCGLTWEGPEPGRRGYYIRSIDEMWAIREETTPGLEFGKNNIEKWNMDNLWYSLSRSKDGGRTWSCPERMDIPFPDGDEYKAVNGNAGSLLFIYSSPPMELSDGSIGLMAFWGNFEWIYHADQVQFLKTTDKGKTWSISPVDATHWEGNESSCAELENGDLLCIIRSNYSDFNWESRSTDKGKTWSRVKPLIPFFGSSYPSLLRTKSNVLVLATRNWGIFTSVDDGINWSLPTHIGGYTGSGWGASLLEMSDGRILIVNATHENAPVYCGRIKGQFIRVDEKGIVHPAAPGCQ